MDEEAKEPMDDFLPKLFLWLSIGATCVIVLIVLLYSISYFT